MTKLQLSINNAKSVEELKSICNNAEPLTDNGFQTSFVRHLNNTFWYYTDELDSMKVFALKLCRFYNK